MGQVTESRFMASIWGAGGLARISLEEKCLVQGMGGQEYQPWLPGSGVPGISPLPHPVMWEVYSQTLIWRPATG